MSMRLVALVALVAIAATAQDSCNKIMDCATCVASPFCGWCSSDVAYQNGARGYQCATVGHGSEPFKCNGVFSTETCERGYACNRSTYQCDRTAPGTGKTEDQCMANCSTVGKTFICDNTTHTCKEAGPGKGTSFEICQQQCAPTHAPSSNRPASHRPASHRPASPAPHGNHTETPKPTAAPVYACNATTLKCDQAEPGRGGSLAICEASCKPSNITPPVLIGLWRAFPVSDESRPHEVDIDFTEDGKATIATRSTKQVRTVVSISSQIWLKSDSMPTMKCVYEQSNPLPETYQMMLACSLDGSAAPVTVASAMEEKQYTVLFMSRCVPDGVCHFGLGPQVHSGAAFFAEALVKAQDVDVCSAFGANCTYCLEQPTCGWCTTDVVYKDGHTGTQCAGVKKDGNKEAWKCSGTYSTEKCLPGWTCNAVNQTCVPSEPGTGSPKEACETQCKGKKGPPTELIGNWRGLLIENDYIWGVQLINVTEDKLTLQDYYYTTPVEANVTHIAGQIFIKWINGPDAGHTRSGIYTITTNDIVTYVDIAFGVLDAAAPTDYKSSMTPKNDQLVLARCSNPSCSW